MVITVPKTDPIQYLLVRKFPFYRDEMPFDAKPLDKKMVEGYKKYLAELQAKPKDELEKLYHAELDLAKQEREASFFFNQPTASADFDYWSKMQYWTLDEAIALSFGKAPERVNWKSLQRYENLYSDFGQKYSKLRDLTTRAKNWGKLFDPILPSLFIKWIKDNDFEIPSELETLVAKRQGNAVDWHAAYKKLLEEHEQLKKQNIKNQEDLLGQCKQWQGLYDKAIKQRDEFAELYKNQSLALTKTQAAIPVPAQIEENINKKSFNTLLRLIAGFAIAAYGYNPNDKKSDAITQIQSDLDLKGINIDADTIRKWVKEGIKLLNAAETKNQKPK